MANRVKSVFDLRLVGIYFENEMGRDELAVGFVEPNGQVQILPEVVQGNRIYSRASGWMNAEVAKHLEVAETQEAMEQEDAVSSV